MDSFQRRNGGASVSWYVQKSLLCSSDGTPVGGGMPTYHVMDENDREICHTYDLKQAIQISANPDMIEILRKLTAPGITAKDKKRILATAKRTVEILDKGEYEEVPR